MPGDAPNLLVQARSALLDALEALDAHRHSVIVVGAQAIYLHTGALNIALPEATKDSDLVIDPRDLGKDPLIESAMTAAGFERNPFERQPGAWVNRSGIPVDLMVPEAFAGGSGRRSVRIPPHDPTALRRARGLEAAVVDHSVMTLVSLDPRDARTYDANVAGVAALAVAKLHKVGEREATPHRLIDKDAHDLYRILRFSPTDKLAASMRTLLADPNSAEVTEGALTHLRKLFAQEESLGAMMAGRAEEAVGNPQEVRLAVSLLASDLLNALDRRSDGLL